MKRKHLVSHVRTAACLLLLAIPASGCGFIFSHAPPDGHEQMDYFTCTESNAGPIIDVIWGSLNVLGALVVASDPDAYNNPGGTVAIGLAWGALSGSAAGVGFNKSKQCRAAKRQLAQRQAPGRVAPPERQGAAATVQAVVITPAADTLTVGARAQLVAAAYSSSGTVIVDRMFAWSSSNDAIASVSSAGLVTAHANGSVVIAARTENVVGTATIIVVSRR